MCNNDTSHSNFWPNNTIHYTFHLPLPNFFTNSSIKRHRINFSCIITSQNHKTHQANTQVANTWPEFVGWARVNRWCGGAQWPMAVQNSSINMMEWSRGNPSLNIYTFKDIRIYRRVFARPLAFRELTERSLLRPDDGSLIRNLGANLIRRMFVYKN